jgi:hypothetical protein
MEEYAFNKIFVGGLHYDTRDGTLSPSVTPPFFTYGYQGNSGHTLRGLVE